MQLRQCSSSGSETYAILSHTWGDDSEEVTMADFKAGEKRETSGWEKIVECCRLADERGLDFVWIDTCCIDKTSSAELTEAINSMFKYYSDATVCFAFLSDLPSQHSTSMDSLESQMRGCKWFQRGWTLQELLAPGVLLLFDKSYDQVGKRKEKELAVVISRLTSIPEMYLQNNRPLRSACVAQRMSWASKRVTKREEDRAYCLLGIFDVNMPLLYGEGLQKAFLRLQDKIIEKSDDETIFAWESNTPSRRRGMLAESPDEFFNGGNLRVERGIRPPYRLVNSLLEFPVPALTMAKSNHLEVALNCSYKLAPRNGYQGISVQLYRVPVFEKYVWYRRNTLISKPPHRRYNNLLWILGRGHETISITQSSRSLDHYNIEEYPFEEPDGETAFGRFWGLFLSALIYWYTVGGAVLSCYQLVYAEDSLWRPLVLMLHWAFLTLGWYYFRYGPWFPLSIMLWTMILLSFGPLVYKALWVWTIGAAVFLGLKRI